MKIMIMTDMEGSAGILNHDDWVMRNGQFFAKGQRFLTEEINAAVDGMCSGGATELVVIDGHGAGGIDPEFLDPRAQLMRGHDGRGWPWCLDASYAGLAFVGQHAKAGTPYSHITHTQWFDYIDLAVNGISIGEYGQMALCAAEVGIPTFFASGEQALAAEAEALTPGVVTVSVKRGLLPDGLDHLDADAYRNSKLSAIHHSPRKARELIREGAVKATRKLKADPGSFKYPRMTPPYVRTARFRKMGNQAPYSAMDQHPTSFAAMMNLPFTPVK